MARSMPSLQVVHDQFGVFNHLENAVNSGVVSSEEADRWRAWLEAADTSGRLFIAGVLIRAIAEKSPS